MMSFDMLKNLTSWLPLVAFEITEEGCAHEGRWSSALQRHPPKAASLALWLLSSYSLVVEICLFAQWQ